jgi:hypothetical protein
MSKQASKTAWQKTRKGDHCPEPGCEGTIVFRYS